MTGSRVPRWFLLVACLSLLCVNPYVRGDGNGYYAWLVSLVIDHDLDFENQYRRAEQAFKGSMFEPDGRPNPTMRTPTGRLGDQWSVGPAMLWAPWFLTADAAVHVAQRWRPSLAADGFSWPYRWACAIGTAVYGWLGLLLAWRAAHAAGRGAGAAIAVLLVWAASPLPVYQYFLPFHVPALSAFVVSWFVWRWLSARPIERPVQWVQWGALAGLMTVVYQLNAVLLVVAAGELLGCWRRRGLGVAARAAASFAAAAAVVWIPQLLGKAVVYGTPWTTGYRDEFYFLSPRLWQTAFSTEHGLFTWHPIALVSVIGLALASRDRADLRWLLAAGGLFFFTVASYQNWHGQSSFGNRFFVSLAVLAVIGSADLVIRISARSPLARVSAAAAVVTLCLWNAGLALQWGTGIIPNKGPVDFRDVARNQVTVVPRAAIRFLRLYLSSRDSAAKEIEERDKQDPPGYKLIRQP